MFLIKKTKCNRNLIKKQKGKALFLFGKLFVILVCIFQRVMVTFVSSSHHYPRCQHDGPLNRGHPRPAVGSHPCGCSNVATLGLGGVVGCIPGCARTPGGGLLFQAIEQVYRSTWPPVSGTWVIVWLILCAIFPAMALCSSEQVPIIKYLQRTLPFRSLTGQKITLKWQTEYILIVQNEN